MTPALLVRDMTLLALRLDRVAPGVFDGPVPDAALARHVADEPRPEPGELLRAADRVAATVRDAGLAPRRRRHVVAQIGALRCRIRIAAGESMRFVDEVTDCFGVAPRPADPERHREVHRRLDELLPGPGPLAGRLAAYRVRDRIPPERLADAARAALVVLRLRARELLGLPDCEEVEVEVVSDRPWTALTRHLGGLRSRVLIDWEAGLRRGQLLGLLAHEAYPGHHVQHCRAAAAVLPELRLRLVHSPQGLLAEGAADAALSVAFGPGWGRVAEEVLAGVGLDVDGALAEAVESTLAGLGRVRQDAALLRHARGAGPDEVTDHLTRWLLVDEDRARRMLAFLDHPHWRGYGTTYAEGAPLVADWLDRPGTDRVSAFRRLLDEPFTPADLRRDLATRARRDPGATSGERSSSACGGAGHP